MIKNFDSLAVRLKGIKLNGADITPGKLLDLIKSDEEHEIELTEGNFYTQSQLDELKTNLAKEGYEDGKTAGSEMTIKELKKKFNIEKEGKTVEAFSKYVTEKIMEDAKIPEAEKVKELNSSLEQVQKKYETDRQEWESKLTAEQKRYNQLRGENYMNTKLPEINGYKKAHLLAAMKYEGIDVQFDENGGVVTLVNGQIAKDDMAKPKAFEDVATDWLTKNGYNTPGGRGAGNSNGSPGTDEYKTKFELMKAMEKQGIDPTSENGMKMINEFEKSQA